MRKNQIILSTEAYRIGVLIAVLLDLKKDKDGYYHTNWGKKDAEGLFRSVNALIASTHKEAR